MNSGFGGAKGFASQGAFLSVPSELSLPGIGVQQVREMIVAGEERNLELLAGDPRAALSAEAMEMLVDLGRSRRPLRLKLAGRFDLPVDTAARLYWWVPKAFREMLVARFGLPPSMLLSQLQKETKVVLAGAGDAGPISPSGQTAVLWRALASGTEIDDAALVSPLHVDELPLVFAALCRKFRMSPEMSVLSVLGGSAEPFVASAKAIGLPWWAVQQIARATEEFRHAANDEMVRLRGLYDWLDEDAAGRILERWRGDLRQAQRPWSRSAVFLER